MTKSRTARIGVAIAIGLLVTAALAWAAKLAHGEGAGSISRVLFWQNTLLQSLVPPNNIGTPAQPAYEATPLNIAAYWASYPLGAFVYAVVAYALLSAKWRHDT